MQGVWPEELFEYHGEFAYFPKCGFGVKPVQKPHPPIFFGGLGVPKIAAKRIAKYGLAGWIGIQDTPDDIIKWRSAIEEELEMTGSLAHDRRSRNREHAVLRHHEREDGSDSEREADPFDDRHSRSDHRQPQAV